MRLALFLTAILSIGSSLYAQRGKDGPVTITAANTIVNSYVSLTANVPAGATSLQIASSAGLAPGDLVFVIQMQGALVNAGRDTIYPDVNSAVPTTTAFGAVTNYNGSGNYEFAQVNSVPNGTSITLDCGLNFSYTTFGKAQVIKVPRYTTLTVNSGYIGAAPWNGSVGGVAVVEVASNTTLNSVPSIDVTGRGFRGGTALTYTLAYNAGGNKFGSLLYSEGGMKGESIAGDTTRYKIYSSVYARGAVANGGGGGCTHNAGGGGGANAGNLALYLGTGNPVTGYATIWNRESTNFSTSTSSGGGRGGYTWSSANQNLSTVSPGNTGWSGDNRRVMGGFGGRPLDYTLGKLFLGGGGGAGHGNNGMAGSGGNGGGIVYMLCYGDLSGNGTIVANGANGSNTTVFCSDNDGGGGAGGGGVIVLNVTGSVSLGAATALSAKGGIGGNVNFNCVLTNSNAYGPGAGGGGGYIACTGTLPTNTTAGGGNGIVTGVSNNIANNFPPNGATMGGAGQTGSATTPTLASANATICAGQNTILSASSTNGTATINWYNAAAGGTPLSSGNTYTTPVYATAGTYTVYAGSCPGTYRIPVLITVTSGLSISVNSPTICAGQTATLTASGASTYTWLPGSVGGSTYTTAPVANSTYTVMGTSGTCTGQATASVTISSGVGITVNNPTICVGQTATLTAGGATSYTWMPGGATTNTISVSPASTSVYTVNGTSGTCPGSQTATVTVNSLPVITAANASVCAGGTVQVTASGASTYTWAPTGQNTATIAASPSSTSVYTVSGTTNGCNGSTTVTVSITPGPVLTPVSTTICPGQTGTLTVSGANSYTWNPGAATGATFTAAPAGTSVYTVTGMATCSAQATATITVGSSIPITVNSPTICSGQTATLTAGGASSYPWNPPVGPTTSTFTASPSTTTQYTVAGSNGACFGVAIATVQVSTTPTVTLLTPAICAGETTTLTANGATSYTWSNGGSASTQTVNPSSSTGYTVTGESNGCTASANGTVVVNQPPLITTTSSSICAGQFGQVTATGATSFTWMPGNAVANGLMTNPSNTTTYTVSGSNGGCVGTATAQIVVSQPSAITAAASPMVGCSPLCTDFVVSNSAACASLSINYGDGTSGTSLNHCYQGDATYTPVVTCTNVSGCVSSYTFAAPITVQLTPVAAFSIVGGTVQTLGATIQTQNTSTAATSFQWTKLCDGTQSTATDLSYTANSTGSCCIRLVAELLNGCKDTAEVCIEVQEQAWIIIPNVFTPNGDLVNDVFTIKTGGMKSLHCAIYDRWGLKMYEWDGLNGGWDGKAKSGSMTPSGTYFYVVDYTDEKNKTLNAKGYVSLLND